MINAKEINDSTLFRIITESDDINWNFFALKVMITRLKLKLSMLNNEKTRQECFADLRDLFNKSVNIPNAKKDFQIIAERFDADLVHS